MPVTCADIIRVIEALAPPHMAESWDNVGLLLGDPRADIKRVLLALDVNLDVAQEAERKGASLIVTHHPLFLKPLPDIRTDRPAGALVAYLIKNDLAVYTAHTNLDSAAGGVNTVLAERLGLSGLGVLHVTGRERCVKLAVFVPVFHADAVRDAICLADAGWIGNYSHCTFQARGTGTFLPLEGTRPYTGKHGELSRVDEARLETIVPASKLKAVLQAMLKAHPYEEPAYDLYPLENEGTPFGHGRVGDLPEPVSFGDFAGQVKEALDLDKVILGGPLSEMVRRVAVCGGSGADLYPRALGAGADVLVTGDVKYHTAQDMLAAGLKFIDAGHGGTERVVLPALRDYLAEQCPARGIQVEFLLSETDTEPFATF
jgi:dinuclear metal center YbgI/SA1388 family protein